MQTQIYATAEKEEMKYMVTLQASSGLPKVLFLYTDLSVNFLLQSPIIFATSSILLLILETISPVLKPQMISDSSFKSFLQRPFFHEVIQECFTVTPSTTLK